MKYNPKIHNRRSVRLKNYDYSQEGAYFITFCCKDKAHVFGEIINNEMILNANGNSAYDEWLKTTEIRSNVELDVFVPIAIGMPNHIHGIVIINNQMMDTGRGVLHTPCVNMHGLQTSSTNANIVHTSDTNKHGDLIVPEMHASIINHSCNINSGVCDTPLRSNNLQTHNFDSSLRSPSNTIGAIIRGYKSAVTKQMNMLGLGNYKQSSTVWQRSFHEHIIRDEKSYQNISNYIVSNPEKWDTDKYR